MQRVVFAALALGACAVCAAQAPQDVPWTPLFNGKDLSGWVEVGGGKWTVQNGEIIGETGDGRYGWLCTERSFADFVLELKFKIEGPGNSGVQFRSHVIDGVMYGYQCDVHPKDKRTGWIYEERTGRKWLARNPDAPDVLKLDDWNTLRISMIGEHIKTELNGATIVELDDERTVSGIIALQVHQGKTPVRVRWKDIRIKDLGYGPGWKSLFNGKDLSGWRKYGEERWEVRDGVIVGSAVTGKYGYLGTERSFKNFILRLKFKPEGPGNSGVFFHAAIAGTEIKGIQAEVEPRIGGHTGGLYETGGRGWLAQPDPVAEKLLRPNDWNELRLKVQGKRITTHLNGFRMVDFVDPEPRFTEGIIALQLHSGGQAKMLWRDIYIIELPDGPEGG